MEATTRQSYTYSIRRHVMPEFGPMRMVEILVRTPTPCTGRADVRRARTIPGLLGPLTPMGTSRQTGSAARSGSPP
ncbi:hypothetical protein PWG71_24135 [Nocardiopsis sp. N85]|uniref:hypothetical protein n=1 Tax=Nocardiopsis sp. N85 TaxID=3029400 RepID=UPI00237F924B|nr:hypothetical protein [Nocardiopsis sp. N85]MDE3724493.1 hypothetical protein [Nocardiopsis sp. N85]